MDNDSISYENLPLKYAYIFLEEKGFAKEAEDIKTSKESYKSYTTTLKRAKLVNILDKTNLLEEFIENWWPQGKSENGIKLINRYRNIFKRYENRELEEDEEEEERVEETSFAYEEDLRDYLRNNLSIIEKDLSLYEDEENNINGVEYSVDDKNKRIDILAMDKNRIPVVIELKVSKGYERVIGQCLYYKNRIKRVFDVDRVRIIIVAREISERLKIASEGIPDIELYEYKLSLSLNRV